MTTEVSEERLDAFVAHLAQPQSSAASEMLAAGLEVITFWGPERMDVWQLDSAYGPIRVRFGIERGRSYGIEVSDPRLRDHELATRRRLRIC